MAVNYTKVEKTAINRKLARIIDALKDDAEKKTSITDAIKEIIGGLERMKSGKEEPKIRPLALYLDVIEILREETLLTNTFPSLVSHAEMIYDSMFVYGENTPDFDELAEIYKKIAGRDGIMMKGFFDPYLFASFTDKSQYFTLVKLISERNGAFAIFTAIKAHAPEARQFVVDDTAYLAYLLKLVRRLAETTSDRYDAVIKEEADILARCNGLYDIDPVRLAQVEKNVHSAELIIENGKSTLDALERRIRDMERIAAEVEGRVENTVRSGESLMDKKAAGAAEKLDAVLREYEESQKRSIQLEKEIFMKELFSEAESEMTKYKSMAKTLTATTSAELAALGKNADGMINRLKAASASEAELKAAAGRALKDKELLDRLEKLTLLNDVMIGRMEAAAGSGAGASEEAAAEKTVEIRSVPVYGTGIKKSDRPIALVCPLLDRNVPFKKRFELAMQEKKRRAKAGELFHEMFDDVLTAVMEEVNPYLIGPSGCGKTYMIGQIGEILNVPLLDIGYINEEYDILGYVTATGEYSESNFYRLYKYGGIAFCDELDNGNSKATVKLNSFLSNRQKAGYCFPGGEYVEKHPNFRVIAAGNTDGSGADLNYSTRERIEESVQQRMIPIYVGYDNRVEKEILKDYPDWFEFACAFRRATNRWEAASDIPAQGIFTTRDAYRIKMYLDNGSFSPEKIMNYEFVQTKEPEYLGFLKEETAKSLKKDSGGYGIYLLFAKEADRRRSGERK
ncbi:MAG: AAA family ATPase [Lachnospiraceae bacterium]|nr:AAA family ATPase [Lachnospiraceae bacterium]